MPSNVDLRIRLDGIAEIQSDLLKLRNSLLEERRELDRISDAHKRVRAEIAENRRVHGSASEAMKQRERELRDIIDKQRNSIRGTTRSIQEKGVQVAKERQEYTKLARSVREADKAQQNLNKTNRVTATLVRQTWQYFSYAFGVYGMVRLLKNVTGEVLKFNAALKTTQTVTGATAKEMEVLRESALNVVRRGSIFSPTTIAEAQTELAKLGLTAEEIGLSIKGISDLAIATGEDMVKSGEIVTSVLRSWGLDASETGRIVDVMGGAFNASALDLTRLNEALKYIGPVAKTVGWTFEDVTAVLAKLADSQIYGSLAGTSLRNILISLADSGSNLSKMLGGTSTSLEDFLEKLGALDDAGLTTVLNTIEMRRALTAFNLVIQRREDIIAYRRELDDMNGAIEKMAGTRMDSAISKTQQLQATWALFWNTVFTSDTQVSRALNALNEYFLNAEAMMRRYGGSAGFSALILPQGQTLGNAIRAQEKAILEATERLLGEEMRLRREHADNIIALGQETIKNEIQRLTEVTNRWKYEIISLERDATSPLGISVGLFGDAASRLGEEIEYNEAVIKLLEAAIAKTDEAIKKTDDSLEKLTRDEYLNWFKNLTEILERGAGQYDIMSRSISELTDKLREAIISGESVDIIQKYVDSIKELTGEKERVDAFVDSLLKVNDGTMQLRDKFSNITPKQLAGDKPEEDEPFNLDVILRTTDLFTNAFEDMASAVVSAIDRIVDRYDTMVGETQSALDTEMRLMEMGYANNVSAKQKELAELKALRADALKDQAEAVRQQQLLESIAQGVNIASAASGILRTAGATGGLGLLVAPGLLAALFALWRQAKVQAIQSAYPEFGEGGWITGPSHKKGGVNINAEGGEFMVNKDEANRSAATKKFLMAFNEGKIDLDRLLLERENITVVDLDGSRTLNEMNKNIRKMAQGGRQYDHFGGYTIERSGIRTRKIYGS